MLRFPPLLLLGAALFGIATGCDSSDSESLLLAAERDGALWEATPDAFTFVDGMENTRISILGRIGALGSLIEDCAPSERCEELRFLLPLTERGVGTYELDFVIPGAPSASYVVIEGGVQTVYLTPPEGGGRVVIETFDEREGIVAGTFEAPLVNADDPNDRMAFSQGRFRTSLSVR